tara:strand:- start:3990 stop:4619 length:630 start_codon:yes stop_codon:yes gene_type:complete
MKIKKLIKVLECIEGDYKGNLPQDMYYLGSYTRSDDSRMGVADMDFVHVMRAFKKMQDILALEIRTDTQEGKIAEVQAILDKYVAENRKLRDKVYNYDKGLEVSVSQTNQITKLEQKVSHLLEKNEYLKERVEELTPNKAIPKYDFSEIPNDSEGQEFLDNVKKYLNFKKYKMRVRGQHIREDLKGKGLTDNGQTIDQSTHLRIYIEEK